MARDPVPFANTRQMLELAGRALGRIDRDGVRASTSLSTDEIEAMAGSLIHLGLIAIPPGAKAPETLICKETAHVLGL